MQRYVENSEVTKQLGKILFGWGGAASDGAVTTKKQGEGHRAAKVKKLGAKTLIFKKVSI